MTTFPLSTFMVDFKSPFIREFFILKGFIDTQNLYQII
jgi:hypothetical protein